MSDYRETLGQLRDIRVLTDAQKEAIEAALDDIERLEAVRAPVHRLTQWQQAYPLEVFPEMGPDDWKRAKAALEAEGMTLDRISASNMRHVLNGCKEIADELDKTLSQGRET